jgi:hypothetical protein
LVDIRDEYFGKGRPSSLGNFPCGNGAPVDPRACLANAGAARSAKEIDIGGAGISFAEEFLTGASGDIDVSSQRLVFVYNSDTDLFCR